MVTKSKVEFDQDPELQAMLKVFAALKDLDSDAQNRVIEYVERRLGLQRRQLGGRSHNNETERFDTSRLERESKSSEEKPAGGEDNEQVEESAGELEGVSPIAAKWMRRNDLSASRLSALYSLGIDEIDLVANKVPGKSTRERLRNVILLQGIASYLSSGVPRVDNGKLKEAEHHYDADVGRNFWKYQKSWAAEVSGSRSAGDLTLTTRGLNSAKDLIKQMTPEKNIQN